MPSTLGKRSGSMFLQIRAAVSAPEHQGSNYSHNSPVPLNPYPIPLSAMQILSVTHIVLLEGQGPRLTWPGGSTAVHCRQKVYTPA